MNLKWLAPFEARAYALLRIVAGLFFAFHGAQKLFGFWTEFHPAFGTQIWIGGVIELVGGLLVALGLGTRWAAFLCSGTMAVAYFQFHWKFRFDRNFFPGINEGEAAALYAFLFLFIACRGAGPWAIEKKS